MIVNDQEIVKAWISLHESVDRIACFRDVRQRFLSQFPNSANIGNSDEIVWRLMQLRKSKRLPTIAQE